jgi:ribosome-binding ATPase YchF (GTP1/OBG family)
MPFTTDDKKINRVGRPKGSMNKATQEIRAKYLELIENNFEQLEKDLQTLKASERVKAIIDLSKFVLPTLKATEMSLSNETKFQAIEIELK